ncbi:MAG: RbsD/FucU family protein [Bifidobacteriaceae bacterium]|jgi:L-fucose mutarotase|nr:RbsD/FucU family protein [Bifidobacteriaceae bacterium]
MLLGINPLLTGPLLAALDQMGHGEMLVVADANYPAYRHGPTLALPGIGNIPALQAVTSVFPLDPEEPVSIMVPAEGPLPITDEMYQALGTAGRGPLETIGRFEFYDLAASARLVLQTGERRPYGCIALRKGVIAP